LIDKFFIAKENYYYSIIAEGLIEDKFDYDYYMLFLKRFMDNRIFI